MVAIDGVPGGRDAKFLEQEELLRASVSLLLSWDLIGLATRNRIIASIEKYRAKIDQKKIKK